MHVYPSQFGRIYQEIKTTSLSHSTCKLIIFVSCLDIDSLCSAKILSNIFRKELIQYQLIPVVGYSDLKNHFEKLDEEVTNVLLIGCGAMLDVESFLEINVSEFVEKEVKNDVISQLRYLKRKVFIIDGHRPWNLDNLFGSSMVICFDDGFVDDNLKQEKSAYEKLTELEDERNDNDDDEEESQSDEEDYDDNDDSESDEVLSINSNDDEDTVSRKRKLQHRKYKKIKRQRRKIIDENEGTIESYYNQGTTIMSSTTGTIYALLSSIGETNIENLWLSIIGTSSLDSHYPEVYDKFHPLFKDEVVRLNPSNQVTQRTADSTLLSMDKDYHLFLLRHWTLYDSFFYSSHVNSKLNLWTEDGKKKLHKLFAKMGVSLAIAQQKWIYMDIEVKKNLPVIFNKYLPLYGLEGVVREGFIRTFGFTGQLSAMECVESLTSLLESDHRIISTIGQDKDIEIEEDIINSRIKEREKIWINNFWSSWDALNMELVNTSVNNNVTGIASTVSGSLSTKKAKGLDLLLQGLESAKKIQQVIFRTGTSLLERRMIKNLKLYRLCVLNDGTIPDLKVFNNPLILAKLGNWILENITELEFLNKNSTFLKPLVVASLDVETDTYLVIGLAPKYPRGLNNSEKAKLIQNKNGDQDDLTTRLNTFSVAFQQVANTSGAKVRIDSFDSSVIEIRKDDLSPFLEKLTLSGLL